MIERPPDLPTPLVLVLLSGCVLLLYRVVSLVVDWMRTLFSTESL